MSYADYFEADARLVILKELAKQIDGRLNEAILDKVLDDFAYNRSREWLRTQLRKMEEIGAIEIKPAGSIFVAEITRAGVDHVERRSFVEGIARPSIGK